LDKLSKAGWLKGAAEGALDEEAEASLVAEFIRT
jgi:hypothetical protein